jgi:hypothetical protein
MAARCAPGIFHWVEGAEKADPDVMYNLRLTL